MVTEVRLTQEAKVFLLMVVMPSPVFTDWRLAQSIKAPLPSVVTLLGMEMAMRLLHPWNAFEPMPVRLLGIVREDRLRQA